MAYFPASSTYPSILGELYSAAFTAPAFNWLCSPAVTELETIVLDWLARLMNLPSCFLSQGEGGGVIQGSASEAIVTVMVAARERAVKAACEGLDGKELEEKAATIRSRLIALGTSESHSATAKAAVIAGVRYRAITLHMEDDLALTGKGLQAALDECERDGLEAFYLTTTMGTTSTCATDHFGEIKEVAKLYPGLWIHVDAAYAGAALICKEYQDVTQHFDGFHSFDMNMHKWLLTNFDARCAFSFVIALSSVTH
jgi:aromatic-L-amino-acid decarboxylase